MESFCLYSFSLGVDKRRISLIALGNRSCLIFRLTQEHESFFLKKCGGHNFLSSFSFECDPVLKLSDFFLGDIDARRPEKEERHPLTR